MKLRIQRCLIPLTILLLITGASPVFGQPRPSRANTEQDRIAVITKFLIARTTGDYELARSFLAQDSRIWFGKKEGEGGQWTVPGRWTNWDSYFNGKVTYSEWTVTGDSVTANGVEINDFYRLIDRPAQPLKATWWFDKNGYMTGFLFEPVRANESDKDKLADFEKWAKRNPEELNYLMPDGQIDPTGDRPARWRTILANWRKAAGLREIAFVPGDIRHFSQGIPNENSASAFSVGFKTLLSVDHSRSYKFLSRPEAGGRPIRLFIWYPTRRSKPGPSLRFADYVYSQSLEKEMRHLTSTEKSSFDKKLAETLEFFNVGAEQVKDLMKVETKASWNAPEIKGKFPLVVLGNVGEGFYYSAMAEYLAANGYVVVTLPSIGANESERCGFDLMCLKIQQADMEFAIARMSKQPNVDASRIGLIAWSFSGLAAAHLQTRNPSVKAVVSLDAATGYQYGKEILDQSQQLEMNKTIVPFMHLHGLAGPSRIPKNFDFFDKYQSKEKQLLEFKNLQHSDFISLYGTGVRYAKKENNETANSEILQANLAIRDFLNTYLKRVPMK